MSFLAPPITSIRADLDHFEEWAIGSKVDPEIVALNLVTVCDIEVDSVTKEVTTPIADLLNWKFTRFGYQVKQSIRGWWVNGVDPLNDFKPME